MEFSVPGAVTFGAGIAVGACLDFYEIKYFFEQPHTILL
jgi:hypothetical protein